jgi:hypothetical protein
MLIESYGTMLINDKLDKLRDQNKPIKMKFAKTAYIPFTNMTLVSLNKLKKEGYVWNMQEDVLIHQTSDQKVCNIEKHYGLATIEFNSVKMSVAVEKIISSLTKEDASDLKENVSLMTKTLTKKDASEENPSIVAEEDAPTEEKMNTKQKEDASTLKKSDTDPVLAAVAVASGGEKLVDPKELNASVISDPDELKSASDNPK